MKWLLILTLALASCVTPKPAPRAVSFVGQPIRLTAPDLSGKMVDVVQSKGRVLVIDFWASWCDPCREELPELEALQRRYGSRGLVIYGVSFDEDLQHLKEFLKKVPVSFPMLWDRGGERYMVPYFVDRLPTTFVVDRKGVIRYAHQAYKMSTLDEVRQEVEQLLGEAP